MFDKFGEFDSCEELNMAAEGLKTKGDIENLHKLAEENGLDIEDTDDYIDGVTTELTTPAIAASGKIRLEIAE